MMFFRIIFILLMVFAISGCASKAEKRALLGLCPEIYVLDKADSLAKTAPGFERTNRHIYQVQFDEVRHECDVDKKTVKLLLTISLDYKKDGQLQAVPPNFKVFIALLDDDKKPIMREYISYKPQEWRKSDNLKITDKVAFSYKREADEKYQPRYIYLGFDVAKQQLSGESKNND